METTGWGMFAGGESTQKPESPRVGQVKPGVARLIVAGVGGGGTNAVNRMIEANVQGVEYIALNTDAQALEHALAKNRLQLGAKATRGLGAGGNPAVGAKAAEESYSELRAAFTGADLVFVTAGMGGGTGTGAGPIVAQAAREQGALAIGIVTTPFGFERRRHSTAEQGILALREVVDALIVVPNERLMQLAAHETGAFEAYRLADDVLRMGIQGISDLITVPGLINLDFADIKAVLADAGSAYMATSQASGENRAELVARGALTNPLLEGDITGAHGLVFNVTGGNDLTMHEVGHIAEILSGAAHPDANIIFGTVFDAKLEGSLKLTVVATGFQARNANQGQHQPWISARVAPGQGRTEAEPIDASRAQTAPVWPAIETHPTPQLPPMPHVPSNGAVPGHSMPSAGTPSAPYAQPIEQRNTQPNLPAVRPISRNEAGPAPHDSATYPTRGHQYYAAAFTAGQPYPPNETPHYSAEDYEIEDPLEEYVEVEEPRSLFGRFFRR